MTASQEGAARQEMEELRQRLQEYSVTYEIPRPSPEDKRYTFGAGYRDETSDTARSRTLRIATCRP